MTDNKTPKPRPEDIQKTTKGSVPHPPRTKEHLENEQALRELHAEYARQALARSITTGVQHRSYRAGSRR